MTAADCGRHPRPRDLSVWKNAKAYGADSKPCRRVYAPGSWVVWTTPKGKRRTGIVSSDPLSLEAVRRHVRWDKVGRCNSVIVPADGGDALPLLQKTAKEPHFQTKDGGRWRPVTPLRNQTNPQEVDAA
ncbi:hypothetical protein GCM10010236_32690 [Streptomyces eurythermus]|nr:hypothetical protein GCM10010236_32690 [Streptomyces eurythermus]